jgi:hypothetical protein
VRESAQSVRGYGGDGIKVRVVGGSGRGWGRRRRWREAVGVGVVWMPCCDVVGGSSRTRHGSGLAAEGREEKRGAGKAKPEGVWGWVFHSPTYVLRLLPAPTYVLRLLPAPTRPLFLLSFFYPIRS